MDILVNLVVEQLGAATAPVIGAVVGSCATVFIGGIGLFLYTKAKLGKTIKEGGAKIGNFIGLLVYKFFLKRIKDNNLRKKLTEDLNSAGNSLDKGWDKGILGIKIK